MPLTKLTDKQIKSTSGTASRTQEEKNSDLVSCLDYGATIGGTAGDNATAINAAIAANNTGFILVPPGVSFTEASLSMVDGVNILYFTSNGVLTILTKNQGTILPVLKGGIAIKSQNHSGVLLRSHDLNTAAEPFLQILDLTNGDLAYLMVRNTVADRDVGILHLMRDSSALERWAFEHQDIDAASTKDLCIYADANDDGIIDTLLAYFIRTGTNSGALGLTKFIEVPEISDPAAPAANKARIYCKDTGAGKSQLVVRFPSGAVQVIATEP